MFERKVRNDDVILKIFYLNECDRFVSGTFHNKLQERGLVFGTNETDGSESYIEGRVALLFSQTLSPKLYIPFTKVFECFGVGKDTVDMVFFMVSGVKDCFFKQGVLNISGTEETLFNDFCTMKQGLYVDAAEGKRYQTDRREYRKSSAYIVRQVEYRSVDLLCILFKR